MRALITGIGGFVGSHLAEHLRAHGDTVVGLCRRCDRPPNGNLPLVEADLTDVEATRHAVAQAAPEILYHLAASSAPGESLRRPLPTLANNVLGTASVLEAARWFDPPPRVLLVTTSEMYGMTPTDWLPLTEATPFEPRHPYGVSKVAVHHLGRQYVATHGLPVIEARPFNHIGPGQRRGFVVPDFAAQVVDIAAGRAEPVMRTGELSAVRDFSDVRDIVRGYRLLALQGTPGEAYHLCSGQAVRIGELLRMLIDLARVDVRLETDPDKLRPGPPTVIVGSAKKIQTELGWQPEIPLEQTLREVLAEWASADTPRQA